MDLTRLKENFSIPGVLDFREHGELLCAEVHAPAGAATVFLQGAHVTHWQPAGQAPVLFLSPESLFARGKAIRGGVPVIFPWFGPRSDGGPGPSHGFARTGEWALEFAAIAGDAVHLTFSLGPTEESRGYGFGGFRLAYEVEIGAHVALRLTVGNAGMEPLRFEEALHTYFAVGDVRTAEIRGLEEVGYLDKTAGGREEKAAGKALRLSGPTDRVYPGTAAACDILDPAGGRTLRNEKRNSMTTVVWNPWKAMPDLGGEAWPRMLCVETANTGADAVTLAPGASHTMEARIEARHMPRHAADGTPRVAEGKG